MSVRYERMNEEIKKTISEIIKEIKDPRICEITTIMSVDVTNDLKQAKVMVSVYDKDDQLRKDTVEALNHGSGFITRELGRRMQLRALPKLQFKLDSSIEYSVHISDILEELKRNRKPQEEIPDDADTQED